MMDQRTSYLTR